MGSVLVLLSPGLLALSAAAALAAAPRAPVGRFLVAASIVAGVLLAIAADASAADAPELLLGVRAGLDLIGRMALLAAAGGMLAAALERRLDGDAAVTLAWRALVAGGLSLSAVAFDAGTLSVGFVALVAGAYGLAVRRPGGRRAAAAFVALAIAGQVLLVDALAEYGYAAESARLDAMRVAAEAELAGLAPLLLAGAYGLPLALVAVGGPLGPALAFVGAGVMALARLQPGPDAPAPAAGLAALAGFALAGGLLARLLLRWRRFAPEPPAPSAAGSEAAAVHAARHPARPAPSRGRWHAWSGGVLARAEARLVAGAESGVLLAALLAALVLALALAAAR